MKNAAVLLLVIFVVLVSGCSWFKKDHEFNKSADQLISEATSEFRAGNYKTSIQSFTDLKDWYPFSKYAMLAELKIADAHYELDEYDEAIAAYQEFENLHPKNEAIPYVIYRIGLCWYERLGTIDKDQVPAKNAIKEFERLIRQFPDDPLVTKAQKKIKRCIKRLAGHEMYVGDFYFKSDQYEAAMKRYEFLFANYPDTREGKEALKKIARCRELMEKEKQN